MLSNKAYGKIIWTPESVSVELREGEEKTLEVFFQSDKDFEDVEV